jgi:hypothetical protein
MNQSFRLFIAAIFVATQMLLASDALAQGYCKDGEDSLAQRHGVPLGPGASGSRNASGGAACVGSNNDMRALRAGGFTLQVRTTQTQLDAIAAANPVAAAALLGMLEGNKFPMKVDRGEVAFASLPTAEAVRLEAQHVGDLTYSAPEQMYRRLQEGTAASVQYVATRNDQNGSYSLELKPVLINATTSVVIGPLGAPLTMKLTPTGSHVDLLRQIVRVPIVEIASWQAAN